LWGGDGVAGGLEFSDGSVVAAFGLLVAVEVFFAEVVVDLAGVQHVPGGDEHGVGDCDGGFLVSSPAGHAPVAGCEERSLRPGCRFGGLDHRRAEVTAALAGA